MDRFKQEISRRELYFFIEKVINLKFIDFKFTIYIAI